MNLSDYDLRQMDEAYLRSLSPDKLMAVTLRLLSDLKKSRDRLNQNPENSSRPPSSQAPWEGATILEAWLDEEDSETEQEEMGERGTEDEDETEETEAEAPPKKRTRKKRRKAGRQRGTAGHGRKLEMAVTGVEVHRAKQCAACGAELGEEAPFEARMGLYVVDVEVGTGEALGLRVTHIKHLYGETHCACGHVTNTEPGRCSPEAEWQVELTEWHLAGPMLVTLIVCLSKRMRLSRPRIQEFLADWLGIHLSTGTINQCIHEAGRAVAPLEDQLVEEVKRSGLLYVDETSWKEKGRLLWLWVFSTATVCLYRIGSRGHEVIEQVLGKSFLGWLMSDGYLVYRAYKQRLRCWAHLNRKACGLAESVDQEEAQPFGKQAQDALKGILGN